MAYIDFNKISWSPEQEQIIYREWGVFFTKKQKLDVADLYYNKSLDLNPNDPKALYYRSKCKRAIAKPAGALADARKALELDPLRQPFNLEVCDGLTESNEFCKATHNLYSFSRKFLGKKVQPFVNRIDVLLENFNDMLGEAFGHFILEHGDLFDIVKQDIIREHNVDKRPLWKILHEQGKCDCMSVIEEEEVLLPPREIARRKRAFDIFNQLYLQKSWIDVLFLKALKSNENLLLPQSQLSRPILENLTKTKYKAVMTLLSMLHLRCPVYTKQIINCPDEDLRTKQNDAFLSRVQYQVRRSMFKMLDRMRSLRQEGHIGKLRVFVEEVMGDYVVLKTDRVMPWKFKFTNEAYNIYGLAMLENLIIVPQHLNVYQPKDRLVALLKLHSEAEQEPVTFVFGDRSTYTDDFATDKTTFGLKAMINRLRKRILFSRFTIEKTYLYHETSRIDTMLGNFDRSIVIAEKCRNYATRSKSNLWIFLAIMLRVKTNALLRKIEKVSLALKEATKYARLLKDPQVEHFVQMCVHFNKMDLHLKKQEDHLRSIRSKASFRSSRMAI